MDTLPPLSELEKDPSFLALDQQGKTDFYNGYFTEREAAATNEDDYNSILKEDSDRKLTELQLEYRSSFPEDKEVDPNKLGEGFTQKFNNLQKSYQELDYNTKAEPKSYKANDQEDPSRAISYKPYRYKGTNGFTVVYPDLSIESIPNISDESQLTDFLKTNRQDRFQPDELDGITEKIRKVDSGLQGNINALKKGWSNVKQAFYASEAIGYKKNQDAYSEYEPSAISKIKELEEYVSKNDDVDAERQLDALKSNSIIAFNSGSKERTEGFRIDNMKSLFDEMQASENINGTKAIDDFNRHMATLPEAERKEAGSFAGYFAKNPSEFLPYVAATVSSSLPDAVAGSTSAIAGTAAGGPVAGAAAAGSYGFAREYSATLLGEIQERSAKEGVPLTPELFEQYTNDKEFLNKIEEKAGKRAGIIGSVDAVTGGIVGNLLKTTKSAVKKAIIGTTLESIGGAGGEFAAQAATEDSINFTEVFNEGLGELGTAAPLAAGGVLLSPKQQAVSDAKNTIKAEVEVSTRDLLKGKLDKYNSQLTEVTEDVAVEPPTQEAKAAMQKAENIASQEQYDKQYSDNPEQFTKDLSSTIKEADQERSEILSKTPEEIPSKARKDSGIEDIEYEDEIISQDLPPAQLTEKAPSVVFRALDLYNRMMGNKPSLNEEGKISIRAAELLTDKLNRGVFNIIADTKSFDRIMSEVRNSDYDVSTQGKLMGLMNIRPSDSNRRIITNVLGNFWSAGGMEYDDVSASAMAKGMLVSEAIDSVYRDTANVTSYYDLEESELSTIRKDDILLNMAPDDLIVDQDGFQYPVQSQHYPEMDIDESVKRFNSSFNATVKRAPKFDASLNDKLVEAKALARPGIYNAAVTSFGKTPMEMADNIIRNPAFKDGFVLKDRNGFGGYNVKYSAGFKTAIDLADYFEFSQATGKLNDFYVESTVFLAEPKTKRFNEYRVHLYVDNNGQAHVFKNLTFNKKRSYYDQQKRQTQYDSEGNPTKSLDYDPNDDTFFLVPDSPNDPVVAQLQSYAKQIMSGKDQFKDMIFGLDTSMVKQGTDPNVTPFVFEANALTYGMSGWLGSPIAMSEIISEMTGRPSVMAGLYEIAKLNLTKPQLTEIASRISEGMPVEYQAYPEYYDAIQRGVATFNRYIPIDRWMDVMKNAFAMPAKFFDYLWNGISNLFTKTVDPKFKQQQYKGKIKFDKSSEPEYIVNGIQKGFGGPSGNDWVPMFADVKIIDPSHPFDGSNISVPLDGKTELSHEDILLAIEAKRQQPVESTAGNDDFNKRFSKKSEEAIRLNDLYLKPDRNSRLDSYINKVLAHPQLTESDSSILKFILKKSNPNLRKKIKVKRSEELGGSQYDLNNVTISISPSATPRVATHEIIHSVTADFINKEVNNLALSKDISTSNNKDILLAYYDVADYGNRKKYIKQGMSPDFINIVSAYMSFMEDIGYSKAYVEQNGAPVGGDSDAPYYWQAKNPTIPYAAINIDEFITETLTRPVFQKRLAKMPSVLTNSKSLFTQILKAIARVIGIPFNKANLLLDSVRSSLDIIKNKNNAKFYKDTFMYEYTDGTRVVFAGEDADTKIRNIEEIPYKEGEVSQETVKAAQEAETEAEAETIQLTAKQEIEQHRASVMKAQFPKLLEGIVYDGSNLAEIREMVIDYLDAHIDDQDNEGKEVSDKKKAQAALLVENKILAVKAMRDLVESPAITDSMAEKMMDAFEFVMDSTEDPVNLTTHKIRYFNNVLESLSDGGAPVGFKYILPRLFLEEQMEYASQVGLTPKNFNKPVPNWIRRPFFGLLGGDAGSTVQSSTELAYIGRSANAHTFLQDLMGTYKENIDNKQLEEATVNAEFYDYLNRKFPLGSIRPIEAARIGIVARLTQYKNKSTQTPTSQIMQRYSQLTESISGAMFAYDKTRSALSQEALNSIIGSQDISQLGNHNDIIKFLESKLTKPELDVLNKTREIGKRYLPSLQMVKAITKNAVLEDWVNYVHDASISPTEETEENILKQFDSMSDVLANREGIDPRKTFPELDIRAIAEHQNKSSTYEKHTGVERYILAQALSEKSPLMYAVDSTQPGKIMPISSRLRELMVTYHNSITKSQQKPGGLIGFAENLMRAGLGTLVVGFNNFIKNTASSSIARTGLMSLSPEALKNAFLYESNRKVMNNFLKNNFPTQYERTSEYDVLKGREQRWNFKGKYKTQRDLKNGFFAAMIKASPYLPQEALNLYSDKFLSTMSNFSNAYPERHNAFAMWTAAYVHYMKENGTVKDANDFIARMPVDRNAGTKASDFVNRSLGYSPDKASKGSFWNGSTRTKQVTSNAFFVFRQQALGLAIEFQMNTAKGIQLVKSRRMAEAAEAFALSAAIFSNSLVFRAAAIGLGSVMIHGGLDRFFKSSDDEEKKKALIEAKRKYEEASLRNNIRDFATETLMTIAPIATSSMIVENAITMGMDHYVKAVVSADEAETIVLEYKKDLQEESKEVQEQIEEANRAITRQQKLGLDTSADEENLEKLELAKAQLTEKIKFRYFPNQPTKALLGAFGGYGIATESAHNMLLQFTKDDLTQPEQIQLQNILQQEMAYEDPLVGAGYGWETLKNGSDLARKLFPSEWGKDESDKLPTELFWRSFVKAGQNPGVVVERGREQMAKELLKARMETQRRAAQMEERYLGQPTEQ